jgi:hypothetical protein
MLLAIDLVKDLQGRTVLSTMDYKRDSQCGKSLILPWYSLLMVNEPGRRNGTVVLNDQKFLSA